MKHRSAWLAGVIGLAAVGLIALFVTADSDEFDQGDNPLIGKVAPDISASDTKGRDVRIEDYRGRWVVVNFFATWCAPCKVEHPELVAFTREHAEAGDAAVISVAYDDSVEKVEEFFATNGGDWAVVAKGTDQFSLEYGVVQLPESYLIDPEGIVVHKFIGGVTRAEIDAEIRSRA